jgi:hypothetical protein
MAAPEEGVKTFVVLVLTVAALFLWQHNSEQAGGTGSAVNQPASSPSPAVSQHDWAKQSLNRANEAVAAVRTARAQSQDP